MEPMQDKNAIPRTLNENNKRHIVMPQLASLNNPPDEQGKDTSLDVPVGVPILTSEDFTWYIGFRAITSYRSQDTDTSLYPGFVPTINSTTI